MAWAPDYAALADVRAYERIGDTADDVQLALAITASSRAIDRETRRQFGLVDAPETRYYTPHWNRDLNQYLVEIDDVMIVTGAAVAVDRGSYTWDVSLGTSDYDLLPRNAAARGLPYTQLRVRRNASAQPTCNLVDGVKITLRWGWSSVPSTIELATRLQVSRLHARRDAPFGIAGSPDQGSELRLLDRLDPDVAQLVRSYYRWWAAR